MGIHQQIITEELYQKALISLSSLGKIGRIAIRLRAIIAAKEHGIGITAQIFGINTNTLRLWAKRYDAIGINGLQYQKGNGRKSNILSIHRDMIKKWVEEDCTLTSGQILHKLREKYNIKSSVSGVHRALKALNFAYITPRPRHYKQDKIQQAEFKKKSKEGKRL